MHTFILISNMNREKIIGMNYKMRVGIFYSYNKLCTKFLLLNFTQMKKKSNQLWINQNNQQNKPQLSLKHSKSHKLKNSDDINGWEIEKPLLEQNLNTFCQGLIKQRQLKQTQHTNDSHYSQENRISYRRSRKAKKQQQFCERKTQQITEQQAQYNQEKGPELFKYQFSHIELLKFQVRHLENEQITNNRLPTFSGLNYSYAQETAQSQQNIHLTYSQIDEMRRKIRSESTKRGKVQNYLFQRMNKEIKNEMPNGQRKSLNATPNYQTLTHAEIKIQNSKQNPKTSHNHSIFKVPSTCSHHKQYIPNNSEVKLQVYSPFVGNEEKSKKQEWKAIHWKKNKPFLKYFQCKRNLNRRVSSQCQKNNEKVEEMTAKKGSKGLKLIEGRKLYQLLNVNRQLIEIQQF